MSRNNQNENQEKIKRYLLENPWKVFLIEGFLFSLSFVLGFFSALKKRAVLTVQKNNSGEISFWQFVLSFFVVTVLILAFVYFIKLKKPKKIIYKFIFIFVTFWGTNFYLEAFLKEPLPLFLTILLLFWWYKKPTVLNQDILMIIAIAGVSTYLGLSIDSQTILLLLTIFSLYDFIAVYKTKHMIKMAKEMVEHQAVLGIILPKNIAQFKEGLEKIKLGSDFLVLGSGDIVFPLLFSISLLTTSFSDAIIVAVFSLIGLFVGFYVFISQKTINPLPALPPIAFFSIVGFFITKIL